MRKIVLIIIPLVLAIATIVLLKPSEEKCRQVATEKLIAANLPAAAENIIIEDYFFMRMLKYTYKGDTTKLGSAAFMQVRVKDHWIEEIKTKNQ